MAINMGKPCCVGLMVESGHPFTGVENCTAVGLHDDSHIITRMRFSTWLTSGFDFAMMSVSSSGEGGVNEQLELRD